MLANAKQFESPTNKTHGPPDKCEEKKNPEMVGEENKKLENKSIKGKACEKMFVAHRKADSQSQTCEELSQWVN